MLGRIGSRLFNWRRSSVAWFLIDVIIGCASVLFAYWWKGLPVEVENLSGVDWHPGAIPSAILYGAALGCCYYAFGGERRDWRSFSWQRNVLVSIACTALATLIVILVFFLFLFQMGRVVTCILAILALLGTFSVRTLVFSIGEVPRRSLTLVTDREHQVSEQMREILVSHYELIELSTSDLSSSSPADWADEWCDLGVQDVVFVVRSEKAFTEQFLMECWKHGLRFVEWNYFVETTFRKLNVYDEHLDWLMHFGQQYAHPSYSKLKRALDIVVSSAGIIISLPLLFFGITMVWLSSGRPVFFKQPRHGVKGNIFTLWKLRTMTEPDSDGKQKVTWVGRFLRKTRLDELPQLFHVLAGEMTLVGPRPEWTEEAILWEKEIPFYTYRTMVKPGITGWAQINFGYVQSRDEVLEKLSYDFYYIKHASLSLDLRILLRTISAMFEGGGR